MPGTLAARMRAVVGPATFREVGEMIGTHPENARRYLQGVGVSVKFLRAFRKVYNVRADWLLDGNGPRERK